MRLILIALLMATGCVERTGYGDGRLVAVYTDSSFDDAELSFIRSATHVWDKYGVRYRTEKDLDGKPAASIYIERSSAQIYNEGCTWPGLDRITIYAERIWQLDPAYEFDRGLAFQTVVAHEMGHSMGLDHVAFDFALMNANVGSSNSLLTRGPGSGEEEFYRVYPPKIATITE
jgi:hypothetical protein